MTYELQLGATGPTRGNPCYAGMGMYSGASEELDTYVLLPGGDKAVYRRSVDGSPWSYCVGPLLRPSVPLTTPPKPC